MWRPELPNLNGKRNIQGKHKEYKEHRRVNEIFIVTR